MSATFWIGYIVIALLALAVVLYVYRRREPTGRGRTFLAALRWAAIALLLLLVFDPRLRQPFQRTQAGRAPVLLDASLSMLLPADDGTRWRNASAEAVKRAGPGGIVLFSDVPRTIAPDSLAAHVPGGTHSRLLPALQAVAEAGTTAVTVITDGDIEDADAIARWLPRLGVRVEWVAPENGSRNATLAELSAPAWAEAGKPVTLQAVVQSTGTTRDSMHVMLRQDGRVIGTASLQTPGAGRTANVMVSARPNAPAGGGFVRIEATIDDGGTFHDDDVRNVYVFVSDDPAGVVLISLEPDWEPRFLLPVLERAAGLPTRGYLRGADGMWLRAGAGLDAGKRVPEDVVRRAAQNADLLVIHNASRVMPAWLSTALPAARRLLVLPAIDASGVPLPLQLATATTDDWFVSSDAPPSPVAPLLTGLLADDVPPLEALQIAAGPPGAWSPLTVTRGRRGRPAPLVLAGETDGKRWAVALGMGYWRWAFAGGAARDVYNRLWSSLAGWLTRDATGADVAALRPVERAVLRGEPVRFVSRAGAMDSVTVRYTHAAGGTPNVVTVRADRDTAVTGVLPPGTYRYDATGYAAAMTVRAAGELTVETYSPEFARARASLADGGAAVRTLRARVRASETKPLHTSWLPYALLLLLLAAEWILRRRWGLR
ncbi:MAG: vWA domain-containing protein [Longimicrobiales bacterium]